MDVNPLLPIAPVAAPLPAGVPQLLRLVAGELPPIPAGQVMPATVMRASAGEAVLSLAGRQITVKGALPAAVGDVVNVRVQPGTAPTVAIGANAVSNPAVLGVSTLPTAPRRDVSGAGTPAADPGGGLAPRTNAVPAGYTSLTSAASPQRREAATSVSPPMTPLSPPVVVDVLSREPNGQLRVKIDGREALVNDPITQAKIPPSAPSRGAADLALKGGTASPTAPTPAETASNSAPNTRGATPPADTPLATSAVPLQPGGRYVVQLDRTPAGLVLRPSPDSPQLPIAVATAILRTDQAPPLGEVLPAVVLELARSAESVPGSRPDANPRATAELAAKLLPSPDRPPTADQLRQMIEDGGTHFEAKLARAAESPDQFDPPRPHTDVKSGLLELARGVGDLATAFPAAAAALTGIERQQATNVIAQQNGGMAVFHIPFLDGLHWRSLSLGVEPDRTSERDASGRPTGFRVMMHVPLTTLGETWIDATAEANRLRAVLYVSDATARERVRGELQELRGELRAGGFHEVLLDVRSAGDLTESQRRKANAVREGVPEGGGLLDVRA